MLLILVHDVTSLKFHLSLKLLKHLSLMVRLFLYVQECCTILRNMYSSYSLVNRHEIEKYRFSSCMIRCITINQFQNLCNFCIISFCFMM
jgi:hypothetical protein